MKLIVNRVMIALLVLTFASVAAFGKTKAAQVTFDRATNVNGTVVKEGRYKVIYDEQTMELSILQRGKLVVKTTAKAEMRARKAGGFELHTVENGMGVDLQGLAFSGSAQNLVLERNAMQAGGK